MLATPSPAIHTHKTQTYTRVCAYTQFKAESATEEFSQRRQWGLGLGPAERIQVEQIKKNLDGVPYHPAPCAMLC